MNCKISSRLLSFVEKCPTAFQTTETVKEILEENGFSGVCEHEKWNLVPGGKYFVTRNLSSIIAFTLPRDEFSGFMIAAAHGDSPAFKIKAKAENETPGRYVRLNTERYGGMIYSAWLDRPLSAAGKIVVSNGDAIESRTVNINSGVALIPNVAIHMNSQINSGFAYNPAVDMQPLFASVSGGKSLLAAAAEKAGVREEDILGMDLFLYNGQKGEIWGADGEFVSAPRLDDLQCVYALVNAFTAAENNRSVKVCCVFDNEEVGSSSRQGAASTFLPDVLRRINEAMGRSETDYARALAGSFMVSADNAHAVHPNHPEYADKSDGPYMNGGVVIKYNAAQRYTTDAVSEAVFRKICAEAGVPVQTYANRADLAGGSTLGNIVLGKVSVSSVDIGLAQLAMHSAYETAGAKDTEYLEKAMKLFFEKTFTPEADGVYRQ